MSERTVLSLMEDIGAEVNGDSTAPVVDSDEYNLFLKALNRSERTWEGVDYNWESLRRIHNTTLAQSGTSVGLPAGFLKLSGHVLLEGSPYIEIKPQEQYLHTEDSEYVVINRAENYMTINPSSPSTVAVHIPYQSKVTTLATSTAIPLCPSDEYLIDKSSSIILFGRSDGRYTELRDEAETLLQQMVGREVSKLQGTDTSIKSDIDQHGFRVGYDI